MRTQEVLERAVVSYRQLDHWCRSGWVHCTQDGNGSGYHREFDEDEVAVVSVMATLVRYGIRPEVAARAARLMLGGEAVALGNGIVMNREV